MSPAAQGSQPKESQRQQTFQDFIAVWEIARQTAIGHESMHRQMRPAWRAEFPTPHANSRTDRCLTKYRRLFWSSGFRLDYCKVLRLSILASCPSFSHLRVIDLAER